MEKTQMTKIVKAWLGLKADLRGVTALEYGLIASLIAVAVITAITTLGSNLGNTFTNLAAKFT